MAEGDFEGNVVVINPIFGPKVRDGRVADIVFAGYIVAAAAGIDTPFARDVSRVAAEAIKQRVGEMV